jgi:adenine phosphoribosyltransferase
MDLKKYIRTVPDFPEKGIMFRDITTLFNNAKAFEEVIDRFDENWSGKTVDAIAGIDARGFIIGGALAYKLRRPFIALRKKGKLPYKTVSQEYDLEYGKATLEIHEDAVSPKTSVLLVDDLIATGGTAIAGIKLIQTLGASVVGCGFIIDLPILGGSTTIEGLGITVKSLMNFDGH